MIFSHRLSDDQCAIFLLHGVTRHSNYQVRNYTRKHILQAEFIRFLEDLCRSGTPISLDDFLGAKETRSSLPKRSFVLTFDDGFENNYSVAAPILDEKRIPAVFYVSTRLIDENQMSWIDKIEHCFEKVAKGELQLPWKGAPLRFNTAAQKIELLKEIRAHVKTDQSINTDATADSIFDQLGLVHIHSSGDPLDQKMSWRQVEELHNSKLFRVGGHSHNHVNMAFLSPEALDKEVDLSIRLLKEKASVISHHYSYPEGLEHCYSPGVISALKARGIRCSPTAIDGTNPLSEDPFHLKRIFVV